MENNKKLPEELLNTIAQIASSVAIEFYKAEREKADKIKARKEDKGKLTRDILREYRIKKITLEEETKLTKEEETEFRWNFLKDLMGASSELIGRTEQTIIDIEKKRKKDFYIVREIEKAMRLYKRECDKSSSEEAKRRYRELHAMYIAEEQMTAEEIAEKEGISKKTVYKDIGIASRILADYLI